MFIESIIIPARDGYALGGTCYRRDDIPPHTVVTVNAATAVPQGFYRKFATFLAGQGYAVVMYDYRGIGASRPTDLRGLKARASDWALLDMAGVVDWVETTYGPRRLFHVGHSFGGQTVGLLPNADRIDAVVTLSSQSGYWRMQGGLQKATVFFHVHFTLPLLSYLFGYMPWSWFGSAEDIPKGVALQWSRWCRRPGYLLSDTTLPLERIRQFQAPILAYSFADDDWGTSRSVDAMMGAYPNLTRRHVTPTEIGIKSIGHFGYFRPQSESLWQTTVQWFEETVPLGSPGAAEEDGRAASW
jgi:predicted alpha/beta hydrolase